MSTRQELKRIERTQLELDVIGRDSLKEALLFVDLDVLTIAQTLYDVVMTAKKEADKLKALDQICKIRGDYVQAPIDDRQIVINLPQWGEEKASESD